MNDNDIEINLDNENENIDVDREDSIYTNISEEEMNEIKARIQANENDIVILKADSGNKVALSIDSNYVMTLQLLNKNNEVLSTGTIDLPIENMIVNASYSNGILTLTLQNGQTLNVDISDIVSGLVSETTFNNAIGQLQDSITALQGRMTQAETALQGKVDKVTGKGLSTEDFTTAEKNKLADLENYDDTEVNEEIAELNEKITELETDLEMATDIIPTGDASGSDITLSDSARYYFKKIVPGGKSEQKQYKGQQLYNVRDIANMGSYTVDDDDWLSLTNFAGPGNANYFTGNLNLEPSTTYKIILEVKSISGSGMLYLFNTYRTEGQFSTNKSINFSSLSAGQKYEYTGTTKDDLSEVTKGLRTYITTTDSASIVFRISVIADTTVTTDNFEYEKYVGGQPAPNPTYECPIKNVTGNVEVKVENKNLLNMSALVQGIYNSSSSAPTMPPVLGSINDKRYRSFSTTLKAGTYTICFDKANSILRDFTNNDYSSNNTMGIGVNNITNATFTIAESSTIYISFRKYDGTDWSNNDLVWLVSGSTATDYEPHEEQTATFPLSEGQRLHKDDAIRNKIVQRRKTTTLTGNETWVGGVYNNVYRYYTTINDISNISSSELSNAICSHFYKDANVLQEGIKVGMFCQRRDTKNVFFATDKTTIEEFKAWLAEKYANGTPVTLEYELETPIETEFTQAQATAKAQIDKLYSYKGTTHITSNANLDVTYRKDLETIIDNLSNAIVAQGGI